jgi:uncharacterized oligopeptide transporter (OPT) family protein
MAEKKTKDALAEAAERDREWLGKTYKGGTEPELTFRSVVLGALIGAVMCLSNLYVGFKAGWSLGVTITAAIMAFALFKALRTAFPFLVRKDMGMLETNALVTLASACAFIATAGPSNAIPALTMVTGKTVATGPLMIWLATVLFLGLFMAIPMKRQMINIENLKFPTGFATSEVLKGMYAEGGDAVKKARALFAALGAGLLVAWWRDGVLGLPLRAGGHFVKELGVVQWKRWLPAIPAQLVPTTWSVLGVPFSRLTLGFEGSLIMVGAGAIMGIRAGLSLLLAAILGYGVLAPIYIRKGDIQHDAPAVVARNGFGTSPEVQAGTDLAFPITVHKGARLAFATQTVGQSATVAARVWNEDRVYKKQKDLLAELNAAVGNPLSGVVVFSVDSTKNRLLASLATAPLAETALSVDPGGVPALGFEAAASDRVLRFPLTLPPGTVLAFDAGEMTGPDTPMVPDRLQWNFPQGATFANSEALLAAFNGKTFPDGTPNPLSGRLSFAYRRDHLVASATSHRQWDSEMKVLDTPGAALFGFQAGQSNTVRYGGFRNVVRWLMWPGVAMMVTAGLLSFFMQWRTVLRAFSGLVGMFRKRRADIPVDALAAVEVPGSWFALGFLVTGIAAVFLQVTFFGIHWWMGVLAVVMSFFLAIVACRATGETDITPVGAMGKITQLMYGGIAPGNMTANLMTANVTAGAAASSADLLQALKCGYLVGASPRKQFVAMLLGVVVGSLVAAPVYNILVPTADVLGTDKLPAPAAQTWAGVALLLSNGLGALPVSARWGLLWGGLFGIAITLCERLWPKSRKFLPSPTAMGIAFVIPAYNSVSMFVGALIAWVLEKRRPVFNEKYTVSTASGLIAGESLMGIGVAVAQSALKWIP